MKTQHRIGLATLKISMCRPNTEVVKCVQLLPVRMEADCRDRSLAPECMINNGLNDQNVRNKALIAVL